MQCEIIIAGFGGQGILSAGRLLAHGGMIEGKNVSWLPSYGPEMRGGTANCHVILSDEQIGSPIIDCADVLIAMTTPAFQKFEKNVKNNGIIIVDSDMIENKDIVTSKKAIGIGAANATDHKAFAYMILIGALIRETGVIKPESIEKALYQMLPESKHYMIPEELGLMEYGIRGGLKNDAER